jgi:hypothetical protein
MRRLKITSSMLQAANLSLLILPLLLTTPSKAFGYTDPGTGAFLYQAAYAAFLGGTFYLRKFLNRIWPKRDNRRDK